MATEIAFHCRRFDIPLYVASRHHVQNDIHAPALGGLFDHLDEVFTLAKQRRRKSLGEHDSLANAQSDGAARSQGDELRPNSFLAAAANQSPLDRAHWLLLKFF